MIRFCPFCGTTPKLHFANKLHYVICENCGCMTQGFWDADSALITWNKRLVTDKYLQQLHKKDETILNLEKEIEQLKKQIRIENGEGEIFDLIEE